MCVVTSRGVPMTSRGATMTWMVLAWLCVCVTSQAYVINAVITDPSEITCWTCPNKTNNEECNNWAPEKFCPLNHTICQTRHLVNVVTGTSIRVLKQCVQPKDCTHDLIGCHNTGTPGVKECISCCNFAYCNEQAPSNHSAAHFFSALATSSAPCRTSPVSHQRLWLASTLSVLAAALLTGSLHR